jgi:competence protein ComEA
LTNLAKQQNNGNIMREQAPSAVDVLKTEEKKGKPWFRRKIWLGGIGFILLIFGLLGFLTLSSSQDSDVEIISSQDETRPEVVVDVSGAVQNPNLYILKGGARVNDALVAAGGLAAEADREWVAKSLNMARLLKDGEKIFIKSAGQETQTPAISDIKTSDESVTGNCLVNINTASASELDKLPGIGEVLSKRIIDYRDQNGLYGNLEDLLKVQGISTNLFTKIKSQICL